MDIGLVGIAAPAVPVMIGGMEYAFTALTIGQWARVMGVRIGERLSAYLTAAGDEADYKQIEDILLDCTYPSDFGKMRDDELESVLAASTDSDRTDFLMRPEHRVVVLSIIHSLNFGSIEVVAGGDDSALERWVDFQGMMAALFKRGINPLLLFDMTMAQMTGLSAKLGGGDE